MAKRRNTAEELAKARVARISGMGAGGLQAMSIGLVLGGCVAVGYLFGAWLDNRFGTGFWMPVGVLLGLVAGFREMFLTVKRISALTQWPGAAASSREPNGQKDGATSGEAADTTHGIQVPTSQVPPRRTQLFVVPEPPLASFEQKEHDARAQAQRVQEEHSFPVDTTAHLDARRGDEQDSDTLRDLMGAESYAELQKELQALNENDSDEEAGDKSSNINRDQPQ